MRRNKKKSSEANINANSVGLSNIQSGEDMPEKKCVLKYSQSPTIPETPKTYNLQCIDVRKLINSELMVQCAVCFETMTSHHYQTQHLPYHNFLCWLIGEEPLDLDNEVLVERVLSRVKLRFPAFIFKCPQCYDEKKSARGFVSHRQFCGKSDEEKKNIMTSCHICGSVLMPSSLDSHIYLNHNKGKGVETAHTNSELKSPLEKCLGTATVITVDYKDQLRSNINSGQLECDSDDDLLYKCSACSYFSKIHQDVVSHIQIYHYNAFSLLKQQDDHFKNGLPFIPFLKNAETLFRRPKLQAKFFVPAIDWTIQQRSLHYANERLFPQLDVEWSEWICKPEDEYKEYLQAVEYSMRVNCNSENWFNMKLFESAVLEENLGLIFCGGPVFGLGWAPGSGKQFLAVAAHLSVHNFYQVSTTCTGPGNIQIWSMGNISNIKNSTYHGTKLEYIICHDEGSCWGLEWCPSGCRDDHRLGLLAIATSSGCIPVYSLPLPFKSEISAANEFLIYKPQPIVRLELGSNLKYQCTRISWSKIKPHRTVAAGFVNGLIAIWDLTTESPLLKRDRVILPFKVFQGHHSIISGLCFSPVSDHYLVSSAYDKTIKFWDLNDTTAPHTKHRRSLATDLTWLQHWMSCAAAIDSVYSAGETTLTLNSIRDFVYEPQTFLTSVDSAALSVSANDWLNSVATSYDNGQVNLIFGCKQPVPNYDDRRKYIKVILEPNLYDFDLQEYEHKPKKGANQRTLSDIIDCNSYDEAIAKYGIDFKVDLDMGYKEKLKGNAANPIEVYPLIAANKVCWNTNIDGFLNLAVGYQSGFVMLPKLSLVPQDQAKVEGIL